MSPCTVVLSGTGTEVGKTWVGVRLVEALRLKGLPVAARKPVQSFDPDEGFTDADLLAAASGENVNEVCPGHRSYGIPLAPPIAAKALSRPPFSLDEIVHEIRPGGTGVTLVEGVGGPRSPLASDGDTADLARRLKADLVVLVSPAGLGAINAVLLCAPAFGNLPLVVFLNRFNPARQVHRTNRDWLEERHGLKVVTELSDLTEQVAQLCSTLRAQV